MFKKNLKEHIFNERIASSQLNSHDNDLLSYVAEGLSI